MVKKRNHCGLLNDIAKVCRNNSKNPQQSKRIENTDQSDNQTVNSINNNEQYNSEYDSSDDNYIAMIEQINTNPIALQDGTTTIVNTDCHLLLDLGSGFTNISMPLATQIMFYGIKAQWSEKKPLELKSFSKDIVETLGTHWKIPKAKKTVVADVFWSVLRRDLFHHLGTTITRKTSCVLKQSKEKKFPKLITRIGKY